MSRPSDLDGYNGEEVHLLSYYDIDSDRAIVIQIGGNDTNLRSVYASGFQ